MLRSWWANLPTFHLSGPSWPFETKLVVWCFAALYSWAVLDIAYAVRIFERWGVVFAVLIVGWGGIKQLRRIADNLETESAQVSQDITIDVSSIRTYGPNLREEGARPGMEPEGSAKLPSGPVTERPPKGRVQRSSVDRRSGWVRVPGHYER